MPAANLNKEIPKTSLSRQFSVLRTNTECVIEQLYEDLLTAQVEEELSVASSTLLDYHQQGLTWIKNGSLIKARYCFSKALQLDGTQPLTYADLAYTFLLNKEYLRAEATLEKAQALMVANPERFRDLLKHLLNLLADLRSILSKNAQTFNNN